MIGLSCVMSPVYMQFLRVFFFYSFRSWDVKWILMSCKVLVEEHTYSKNDKCNTLNRVLENVKLGRMERVKNSSSYFGNPSVAIIRASSWLFFCLFLQRRKMSPNFGYIVLSQFEFAFNLKLAVPLLLGRETRARIQMTYVLSWLSNINFLFMDNKPSFIELQLNLSVWCMGYEMNPVSMVIRAINHTIL